MKYPKQRLWKQFLLEMPNHELHKNTNTVTHLNIFRKLLATVVKADKGFLHCFTVRIGELAINSQLP